MRSLVPLDSHDLRGLSCPWCGRTPPPATFGVKAVRGSDVLGALACAPASELGGFHPTGSVVITQAWVRREDLGELIGTQMVHRVAAKLGDRRVRCIVAPGTHQTPDCHHLPGQFLDRVGFVEFIPGAQWKLDLRRTLRVPDVVRQVAGAFGRLARPEPTGRGVNPRSRLPESS